MTHSHHRLGDNESLKNDFVLICRVSRYVPEQMKNREDKFRRLLSILRRHDPVCLMVHDREKGRLKYFKGYKGSGAYDIETVVDAPKPTYVNAVFDNKGKLERALREIKEADLGISIVVSGIFDEVFLLCDRLSTDPHTVNMSLGVMGNIKRLPPKEILEITTMCGHGVVSSHLVKDLLLKVRKGTIKPEEAAYELAKQCPCGIFNHKRAAMLLRKYAGS